MKATQQTQVKLQQQKAEALKGQVCEMLQWDEMTYCTFQYQQGLSYLQHTLLPDMYAINYLERDKQYWAWFKNKWMQNDEAFIILAPLGNPSLTELCRHYSNLQSGRAIATHNPLERFLIAPIYSAKKLRHANSNR